MLGPAQEKRVQLSPHRPISRIERQQRFRVTRFRQCAVLDSRSVVAECRRRKRQRRRDATGDTKPVSSQRFERRRIPAPRISEIGKPEREQTEPPSFGQRETIFPSVTRPAPPLYGAPQRVTHQDGNLKNACRKHGVAAAHRSYSRWSSRSSDRPVLTFTPVDFMKLLWCYTTVFT